MDKRIDAFQEDSQKIDSSDDLEAAEAFTETLDHNPMLRTPAICVLGLCEAETRELGDMLQEAETLLQADNALPVQPLSSVVDMLARAGMLERTVEVDGRPYEGTLRQAIEDDALPEEATILEYARTTAAGSIALELNDPLSLATRLLGSRPTLRAGLFGTLALCDVEGGLATKALEVALDERGLLSRDERTGLPTIYPSTFTTLLRNVGAIRWDHAWFTTDLGRQVLEMAGSI